MAQNHGAPYDTLSQLPIIGPWASRMGQIHDIYATPCRSSPEIWVKAAWVSLPRLLYLFAKPFLIADQWHARTGRGHRPLKGFAKVLAEALPVLETGDGIAWKVFKFTGDLVLKLEWYIMIIDRTTEFEVNWSSMVYNYSGCHFPGQFWIEVERTDGVIFPGVNPILVGPMFGTEWPGRPVITGTVGIPEGFSGVVNYQFSAHAFDAGIIPPCKSFNAYLKDFTADTMSQPIHGDAESGVSVGGADSHFIESLNEPGHVYGIVVTGDGGGLAIDLAKLACHAFKTGDKGLSFDP